MPPKQENSPATTSAPLPSSLDHSHDSQLSVSQPDSTSAPAEAEPALASNTSGVPSSQNVSAPTNNQPAQSQPKKLALSGIEKLIKTWYFWAIAGLTIFAVCSLAFGAYELNNDMAAQDEIARLNTEVDRQRQQLIKYGAQLGIKVDENGYPQDPNSPTQPAEETIASQDYIYIGEWGLKFKIPSDLTKVSYIYDGSKWGDTAQTSLRITGLIKAADYYPDESGYMPAFSDFREINTETLSALGTLTRVRKISQGNTKHCPDIPNEDRLEYVHTDDNHCYLYSEPDLSGISDEQEHTWAEVATKLIRRMLSQDITTF